MSPIAAFMMRTERPHPTRRSEWTSILTRNVTRDTTVTYGFRLLYAGLLRISFRQLGKNSVWGGITERSRQSGICPTV